MKIAVLTPSKESRDVLREECRQSVRMQKLPPGIHLLEIDNRGLGPEEICNRMVAGLDRGYDWLAFLDDDDIFLPWHLERLAAASEGMDVVYSKSQLDLGYRDFDAAELRKRNYISVTSLVRRSIFEAVGGFEKFTPTVSYDWSLWLKILDKGGKFRFVPEVTWIYRIQNDSMIWKQG